MYADLGFETEATPKPDFLCSTPPPPWRTVKAERTEQEERSRVAVMVGVGLTAGTVKAERTEQEERSRVAVMVG